ncbi:hypothetical protein [Pedobacter paludis]|uniref:Uncharacterized protein n=1 Tax=Pedobacter paludis TaxID=2203212 RepID=A0A317F3H5_9SPHI|nr:hypothetical protein [Pedobacter paludis]PWS33385.1 hypothetical protein DF947_01795 [Pedobacter paludis]
MVISKIIYQDCVYFNLHAEQSFTGSFLADKGDSGINICEGIFGTELTLETLSNIETSLADSADYRALLDFRGIRDVQANLFKVVIELTKLVKRLAFINVTDKIIEKLNLGFFTKGNVLIEGGYQLFVLTTEVETFEMVDPFSLFKHKFTDLLVSNTLDNKGDSAFRHNSPVYIPKFIDVKGIIIADPSFFTYVIYYMAININQHDSWNVVGDNPILFCQNLNGSYICSILSRFLKWDMLSMDHIGPANKVYSSIGNKIRSEARYLVISDVICLGTEIKICQNIINYSGGRYLGNACVVKIETLLAEHQDKNSVSVFSITESNNPIDFKILTALSPQA